MSNKYKLLVSFILVICIFFAPVPGWQRPAAAWFGFDDLAAVVVGVVQIIAVATGMTWLESNSRQSTPPSAPREVGYGLAVSADRADPQLSADGESNMKVRVMVKKDGEIIDGLPSSLKLFAYHNNGAAELVQINSADKDFASAGSGDLSLTRISPRYGTTGRIRLFEYYVNPDLYPEMVSVTLKVRTKADNSLAYSRTESEPLNSSLKPFYWNGKTTDGAELPPGTYAAELSLLKSNGEVIVAPRADIFINKSIGTSAENLPYVGTNTYLLMTSPDSASETNDTINVTLKDFNNGERNAAEGRVNFSFKPAAGAPAATENRLTFSTSLRNEVDGVPVKVEVPGASGEILRVTVFEGNAGDQVRYEYNLKTRNIVMRSSSNSRTYGPGNAGDLAAYYSVLKIMEDMIKSVYAASGLRYDVGTKQLTIDQSKYVDKIDPAYDVSTATSGNIVAIKLTKGTETVTCDYDLVSGTVSMAEELAFADNYGWDYQTGGIIAGGGAVAAAGVKASGIDLSIIPKIISFPIDLMYSLIFVTSQLAAYGQNINTQLQPMPHLEDPQITNIDWRDKAAGLVLISGKADVERQSEMKIYINNAELTDPVAWSGTGWSVVNYSRPVQAGKDNKLNVILRKADGREAESGDATVYKGLAGQPDLILLSPRDRQILASETVPACEYYFGLSGKTSPNARISLLTQVMTADASGVFSQEFYVKSEFGQKEGPNSVLITVEGSSAVTVNKTLIGAYKFVVGSKPEAYVLRKGDLIFNGKSGSKSLFDWVVFDPDHTGIYVGNGKVVEAVWNEVKTTPIDNWKNAGFYTASQFPVLNDESRRDKVVAKVMAQTGKGYEYDIPISLGRQDAFRFSLKGHYDGPGTNNHFYCSELAYWAWETVARDNSFDLGIKLEETMYPGRGLLDIYNNSVLPAYLCEKTMAVGRVNK